MALSTLTIDLAANVGRLETDLKRAQRVSKRETEKLRKDMAKAGRLMGAALATAATGLAVLVKRQIDAADQMQKLSQRTQASTEFLSEMKLATELSGVEFGTFTNALGKMQKAIGDAVVGLSTQKRAFEELHIDIEKFQNLNVDQQFEELAESLSKVKNASQQVRIARDIFGRSGQELLSLFKDGKIGIQQFREEAQRLGLTIGTEMADKAALFNDNLTRLKSTFSALIIQITSDILPDLIQLSELFLENSRTADQASGSFSWITKTLKTALAAMVLVKETAQNLAFAFVALADTVLGAFQAILAPITGVVEALSVASVAISRGDFAGAAEALGQTMQRIGAQSEAGLTRMKDGFRGLTSGTLENFRDMFNQVMKIMADAPEVAKDAGESLKKLGDDAKKGGVDVEGLAKKAMAFAKQLAEFQKQIEDNAESVRASLLTPLEALREEFAQNEQALLIYISSLEQGSAAQEEWLEVLERLRAEFKKQEAALEDALTPYEQLIQNIEREIQLLQASEAERMRLIATWELEASGIAAASGELERYLGLIQQRNALVELQSFQGAGGFENLLAKAIETGFEEGVGGMRDLFKEVFSKNNFGQNADLISQGVGFVGQAFETFRAAQEAGETLFSSINKVLLAVPFVQYFAAIAEVLDAITGGGLFGTKFATDKAIVQLGVDAEGAFGGSQTFQSKKRSFFRGTARRVLEDELTGDALDAIKAVFDAVQEAIETAAGLLAVDIPNVVAGAFEQEFDAEGNLVKEFSTVLGRVFEESFQDFATRLIAENILEAVSQAVGDVEVAQMVFRNPFEGMDPREIAELGPAGNIPGFFEEITVLVNEAQHIAERWRQDAATLLEGAQFLLVAVSDLRNGVNLLTDGTLTELTDLVEDLSKAGEQLSDTYVRIKADTELLEQALRVMGATLDLTREDFIRFAVDIEEAAGGLQRASQLWSNFFDRFMTENERTIVDLEHASGRRDELLAELDVDAAAFEEAFRAALPSLSAEDIVTWLEAAVAIGQVMDLEEALAEQRQELLEIFADSGVFSGFQSAVLDLVADFDEAIKRAGQLGASERELNLIRQHANRNMARLVAELEVQTAVLAEEFLGTNSLAEARLTALEEERDAIESIRADRHAQFEAEKAAIQRLREFADSLLLNQQLTPLTPREQLEEARRQFRSTLGAARGGDTNALSQLQGSAQSFLTIARDFFASSPAFSRIFDEVQGSLRGLEASNPTVALTTAMQSAEAEIITLRATLEANNQALQDFQRALQLETLLSNLRDLADVRGLGIEEVAGSFGLDLEAIISALEGLGIAGFDPDLILARASIQDTATFDAFSNALGPVSDGLVAVWDVSNQGFADNERGNVRIIDKLETLIRLTRESRDAALLQSRNAA